MSQNPHKPGQKMCKSPKNVATFNMKTDKIDYESMSTNCTVVGSNNLNLVKKPVVTNLSPAYSNSSPGYPQSPYSSPNLKSPSPSLKPPTPQPVTGNFPVMQIIQHNNHQLLARPIPNQQQQNIIKLKPHLNILPKPSASPQPSPKQSVSPQIMIPTNQQATIMPSAQPLLLNQMPMLTTTPGVQFILKPQTTAKIPTATPQGLILQPGGQSLIQIQPPRSQPMVRVLTNSVQIAPSTTTAYVTAMGGLQTINSLNDVAAQQNMAQQQAMAQQHAINQQKKQKAKPKSKKKLDLANIMKLSGIGDEDDIQFESDTSQSESEHNPTSTTPQPQQQQQVQMQASTIQAHSNIMQTEGKKIQTGIQIQGIAQPTINAATPVVQVLNQNFHSGMISNTSQASQIPFNPFIAPNFTINNGLMVQRTGGFKLTVGEDGRLVLQHDPTLNQDLQSQLILQSVFGLNGGLVFQPSIDQQTVQQTVQTIQQQSVQTIQQQTVQSQTIQTVQQQTVPAQTVQHSIQALQPQIQQQTVQQTIQHQTVQSQPLTATIQQQPAMQIVQPQPIHSMQSSVQPQVHHSIQSHVQHSLQSAQIHGLLQQQQTQQKTQQLQQQQITISANHSPQQQLQVQQPQPSPQPQTQQHSQPVLKVQPFQKSQLPVQTVHPQPVQTVQPQPIQAVHPQPIQAVHAAPPPVQPIHSQLPIQSIRHSETQNFDGTPGGNAHHQAPTSYVVNLTPDQLEQLKRNGQLTVNGQTIFMPRSNMNKNCDHAPAGLEKKMSPKIRPVKKVHKIQAVKNLTHDNSDSPVKPAMHVANHQKDVKNVHMSPKMLPQSHQPKSLVQPAAMVQPQPMQHPAKPMEPKAVKNVVKTANVKHPSGQETGNHDVDKLLGQLLDDGGNGNVVTNSAPPVQPQQGPQMIQMLQITPQKQQHLRNVQMQIQALSAQMSTGNVEVQSMLKALFAEQQKILATGKLLPPDKVYYHNNQLTIVNPTGLNSPPAPAPIKNEPPTGGTHQHVQSNGRLQEAQNQVIQNSNVRVLNESHHSPVSQKISDSISMPPPTQLSPQTQYNLIAKKAHLVEAQLNQDQIGAQKPDVHTPFRDKKDACIRLVRYHCLDEPILSERDLDMADQYYELTAKHFLGKYERMVDKYKYLLLKESMKQVKTSELMMMDRMFNNDEEQSLLMLRQEQQHAEYLDLNASFEADPPPVIYQRTNPHNNSQEIAKSSQGEDYDEWACIQRELGCLPNDSESSDVREPNAKSYAGKNYQNNPSNKAYTVENNRTYQVTETRSSYCVSSDHQKTYCVQEKYFAESQQKGFQVENATTRSYCVSTQSVTKNFETMNSHKRPSASADSRLETLKRFRVDKHHKKTTENNVHNNSVNSAVQSVVCSSTASNVSTSSIASVTTTFQNTHGSSGTGYRYQQQSNVTTSQLYCDDSEIESKSIDEQVQSAIDSILNLQQNTQTALDLDSILS